MNVIAWIGKNWKDTPCEESYLTWDKPHSADDPEPSALVLYSDVAPLVEALRTISKTANRYEGRKHIALIADEALSTIDADSTALKRAEGE